MRVQHHSDCWDARLRVHEHWCGAQHFSLKLYLSDTFFFMHASADTIAYCRALDGLKFLPCDTQLKVVSNSEVKSLFLVCPLFRFLSS